MSNIPNAQLVVVAVSATIGIVSAASLFIYQKVMERKERTKMMSRIDTVNRRVNELQSELETLRAQQNQLRQKKSKTLHRKRIASGTSLYSTAETDNEVDAISITETDIDDEFYDCSDDEINADFELNSTARVMTAINEQLSALDLKMESEHLYEEVLSDLRDLAIGHENNVEVAWRLARACFKHASNLDNVEQKEALVQEGMKICENMLEMEHIELHKYYALLIGLRTEYLPIKEKLEAGKLFEKHVKKGLQLTPNDSTLNHLLGRFQYNVAELTWVQKKICQTLFGEAPSSTYGEAIQSLEKAEKYLESPDIENKFFLGQSYLKIKAYKKGVDILKELIDLLAKSEKQENMKKKAADLVSKYSGYC